MYKKDFDNWNTKKKRLESLSSVIKVFFYEREVWWVSIGVNVGVEADGKRKDFERPVLILKKFNGEMFWGIPLTSKQKEGKFYYALKYSQGVSWANIAQLRVFSTKRLLRKIGTIDKEDFECILTKVFDCIQIDPRKSGGLGGRSH